MKLRNLFVLTILAYLAVVAFRTAVRKGASTIDARAVAEKKKFSIRCSPAYLPVAGDDIPVLTGWGNYSWKISTAADSAQIYFNQGINMYYAFHIIESRASFDKATRFDPNCAIAWWGKALAFGPNINDFGYQAPSEAYPSAMKANELKANANPVERALIEAMVVRYSADSTASQDKLNVKYRDAMKRVYNMFANDENVTTLYADALMLLHPWDLYAHDFVPKPWTPELVSVLKHALQLNPKHPGANHLYIHAVEASANPGAANASAAFLETAMPDVSHITHMPSHVYIRTGVYNRGITVNDEAVSGYNKYFSRFAPSQENIALYVLHNIHMKLNCAQMAGNYKIAANASRELQGQIPAFYLAIPGALGNYVQYLNQSIMFTQVRFGKWDEILAEPVPDTLSFTAVLQHFARGLAFVHKNNPAQAIKESQIMLAKLAADSSLKEPMAPFNSAYNISLVARDILAGAIALSQNDNRSAIALFTQAVKEEDDLIYNEPRDWLLPARHYLGNALIQAARYNDAVLVFKKDLQINPGNGWALTGLLTCYQQQKNKPAADGVLKRLKAAWSIKDIEVKSAVF